MLLLLPAYSQTSKQYSFTHYSSSGGLSSYEVMSALQDETGFIWIGTNNGLQRFDGSRYVTFRKDKNSTTSIPNNVVSQVFMDKKSNLWIVTGDGKVGIFDTRRFVYRDVPVSGMSDMVKRADRKLITDDAGHIFLLIYNLAFATLNEEKMEFSPEYNFIPIPKDWKITSFAQQPGTKKYWIGRSNGLAIYNARSNHFNYSDFNVEEEAVIYSFGDIPVIADIFFDKQGRVWFDSWKFSPWIYCFDLKRKQKVLEYSTDQNLTTGYHEVKGFMEQKNGDIWIKGLGVLAKYLEKEKTFQAVYNAYTNEQSIYYDRINDFFEDREENIWLASSNNGIYRFNPSAQFFTNISHTHRVTGDVGSGGILSFMRTRQNTLLVGTWGDGIYHYDRNNQLIPLNIRGISEKNSISAWGMCLSPDSNTIWMSCQPGIIALDQKTWTARTYVPKMLKERTIRQIASDRFGNLWLGTQSIGLLKWTASKGKNNFDDGLSIFNAVPGSAQIMKILTDRKGYLWVSTTGFGVYVINPATDKVVMHFGTNEAAARKLNWDAAVSLLQYDDTTMIIASNGIHFYNTRLGKITNIIPLPESVPSELTSMERDKSGYLWLSSTSGIFRVNPKNQIWIHFDRVDGIVNDRFVHEASYSLPDGTLLFGSDNQFVIFDPEEVKINNSSPDIAITAFKLMNQDLLVDSLLQYPHIDIPPDENSIVIEFSGLRYDGTYLIMYKLDNIDKDWKTADASNQAIYTYLPPGKYNFLVKSQDAEGNAGKNITQLKIQVHPYFWRTWWFYSLLVLLALVILYGIDRERIKRLKDLQRMRTEIANNLHKDVTTTLSNINLLGEMAKIKADKDITRSKEYIDQISNKSHNMIIAMDDILWSIDPENDSMEKTLLRMMEFTDALKNRYNASIELALDKKLRTLKLDMRTRNEFFLIFKVGLRLIVQYAGGTDTVINIDLFRNRLSLKLQDATGHLDTHVEEIEKSIKEINSRAKEIHAEADVQYDKNGVAIILLIPVK